MTNPIQELIKRQDDEWDKLHNLIFSPYLTNDRIEELNKRNQEVKYFLSQCRQELLDEVVKMIRLEADWNSILSGDFIDNDGKAKATLTKYFIIKQDTISKLTKLKE